MEKISATIITLNEEKHIQGCINALKKVADEIIVVDSFSKDKTVEICEQNNCKVFQRKFTGFGSQKQFGIDKASYDWVISIDADEFLSPQLIEEIQKLKQGEINLYQGYYLPFSTFYLGKALKFCGLRKEKHLRLFNKKYGSFIDKEIHEQIKVEGQLGILKGKVIHHTYENTTEHLKKINDYTSRAAADYIRKGKNYSRFKAVSKFTFRFFTVFIIKGGMLDGYQGYMWSLFSAFYATVKYVKYLELKK